MAQYFDRYNNFKINGEIKPIPGIYIPSSSTDMTLNYKRGVTRLDIVSNLYYNNPYSGWLILAANPEYGGLEFKIPDMEVIRIPFPYADAISRYINEVTKHITLYGE